MSDYLDARNAAAMTALADAVTANSDDPVDEDGFIAEMFPSSEGAGMGERLGYRVLARNILGPLVTSDVVTRTYDATDGRARYIAT